MIVMLKNVENILLTCGVSTKIIECSIVFEKMLKLLF
jgi:hypothetical protein